MNLVCWTIANDQRRCLRYPAVRSNVSRESATAEKGAETPLMQEGMAHADFRICTEFRCGSGIWRSTDVGIRTVIAIRVDRVEIGGTSSAVRTLLRQEAEDDGWLAGPPCSVSECVFDEDDFPSCTLIGAPERSADAALPLDTSAAGIDTLVIQTDQRLGIDSVGAIQLAVISYLRQLDGGETLSQRIAASKPKLKRQASDRALPIIKP